MTKHPWERQSGESSKTFDHFCAYRDLGPSRTLAKTAKITSRHIAHLFKISTQNRWVTRCELFDAHMDKIKLKAEEEELKKNIEIDRKTKRSLALFYVKNSHDLMRKKIDNEEEFSGTELIKMGIEGFKLLDQSTKTIEELKNAERVVIVFDDQDINA